MFTNNPDAVCVNGVPDREIVTTFSVDPNQVGSLYTCAFSSIVAGGQDGDL